MPVTKTKAIYCASALCIHLHALPFTMERSTSMSSSRTTLVPSLQRAQTHIASVRGLSGGRRKPFSTFLTRAVVYGEDMSCDPQTYVALVGARKTAESWIDS